MAMTPDDSVRVFERTYLPAGGKDASPIRELLQSVWAFYREERPVGLTEDDSDMLLFQYGTYDWGSGPQFELDLTRQFVEILRDDEEDVYSQFHLTCFFAADERLTGLGSNDRWCCDVAELDEFATWVEGHEVFSALETAVRVKTEISWDLV